MNVKLDNRMGWIRNIEKLKNRNVSEYHAEYEIASESFIPGILDYQNGAILCGLMTHEKDSRSLYKYLLKIKYSYEDNSSHQFLNANKKGYLFKEGIPGELISIFSFFFQYRFFLLAAYFGKISPNSIKIKKEYTPQVRSPAPHFDPTLFPNGKRNFSHGITGFLDKLKSVDVQYHQQIILGLYHYARAIKEFGIDEEMVFIRLVSAIEAFSKWSKLLNSDDLFNGKNLSEIVKLEQMDEKTIKELETIFNVRKSRLKFKRFIETYSKGFFKGGNFKAPHTRIKKADLSKTLDAIYISRSKYLHNGEAMYLSQPVRGGNKWDTDPS